MSTNQANEFFDGFSWAVPLAFADPLAACRFEQGDILYNTRRAYEGAWGEALPHITYSVQVKFPSRGTGTKTGKEEDSVFTDNWNMTIVFSFTDHKENKTREVTTTQGRLYSLLWKGDLHVIDKDAPPPPVPMLAMQILSDLPSAIYHVKKIVLKGEASNCVFLMPYDRTRLLLKTKFQKVEDSLKGFKTQICFVSPSEAELASETGFAPTVSIACFCVHGTPYSEIEQALKKALYTPSKDKKTDKEGYRITAHGYLFAI